jgi:hypothetical protein
MKELIQNILKDSLKFIRRKKTVTFILAILSGHFWRDSRVLDVWREGSNEVKKLSRAAPIKKISQYLA